MGLTLGFGFLECCRQAGFPGGRGLEDGDGDWGGKGLSLSPGKRLEEGRAVLPTQPGSARGREESQPGCGVHTDAHTAQKSVCQEFGGRGSFPWRRSQGRKRGHPTKTLGRKEVPDLALAREVANAGRGHAACGAACRGSGYAGERGRVLLSLLVLFASPLPIAPARSLPPLPGAGCPLRTRAPSRAEPRLWDRMQRRSGVSAWV